MAQMANADLSFNNSYANSMWTNDFQTNVSRNSPVKSCESLMCRYTCSLQREGYRRALATNITTSVSGVTVETLAYSFDALGRPVSRNADSFGYNARSEVVFSRGGAENAENTYAYDYIGNLTLHESPAATNAYTANNLNQFTAISNLCASVPLCETNPAYDTDGNLVSDGVFAYAYDSANRLTSVSSNGISVATFAYDAKSRRVRKTTPSATHTYFYDDWNLVKETVQRSNGSTVQRTYVWGKDLSGTLQGAGGVGGLLAVIHDNIPYFPCYDNNGNITRYLDTSGATVAAYTLTPPARPLPHTPTTPSAAPSPPATLSPTPSRTASPPSTSTLKPDSTTTATGTILPPSCAGSTGIQLKRMEA